ncbi:hypothetical protein CUU66_22575 [Peribacillus deserti]|uniref:Uncharacterized protein n=1 Tax=Peribacillus deserti TaxID=673318 RepID=A0A2N5LZX3_9BACI|nr:hypothetical protein CUU66_22575 [Peribacillus deserti]
MRAAEEEIRRPSPFQNPNTEVKLFSADGSPRTLPPVRVGRCQAERRSAVIAGLFFVLLNQRLRTNTNRMYFVHEDRSEIS